MYNLYHKETYNPNNLDEKISELLKNDEVQNKKGIITYLFDPKDKYLNLRTFSESQKLKAYEDQEGICPTCKKHFEFEEMEGANIVPWSQGGKTPQENCQMLCKKCNREKSDK